MGGKIATGVREKLRAAVDEDQLASVIVAGLDSESLKERLDVAKLIVSTLSETTQQDTHCICHSSPGAWCPALDAHGYRAVHQGVNLAEVARIAAEIDLVPAADAHALIDEADCEGDAA
jgi:hypothetical protein